MDLSEDGRMIGAAISGTVLLPLFAFKGAPDPLAETLFSIGGASSAVVPFALAHRLAWPTVIALNCARTRHRELSFAAGLILGLIPALFYSATMPLWTAQPPLGLLFLGGGISGVVAGGCAVAYFGGTEAPNSL